MTGRSRSGRYRHETHSDPECPEASFMPEGVKRITESDYHNKSKGERIEIRRNAKGRTVKEAEEAEGPSNSENCSNFHQVLLG